MTGIWHGTGCRFDWYLEFDKINSGLCLLQPTSLALDKVPVNWFDLAVLLILAWGCSADEKTA